MGSLIGELEERRAAVRARVEDLEGQIAVLTGQLEAERLRLERETLDELAAEGVAVDAVVPAPAVREPVNEGQVVGVQTVMPWQEGMTSANLPPVYRDIVEVIDDAPGPVQAKQIVPRIGLPVRTSKIEGTRGKLKRLVERGWLAEGRCRARGLREQGFALVSCRPKKVSRGQFSGDREDGRRACTVRRWAGRHGRPQHWRPERSVRHEEERRRAARQELRVTGRPSPGQRRGRVR